MRSHFLREDVCVEAKRLETLRIEGKPAASAHTRANRRMDFQFRFHFSVVSFVLIYSPAQLR